MTILQNVLENNYNKQYAELMVSNLLNSKYCGHCKTHCNLDKLNKFIDILSDLAYDVTHIL